MKNPYAGNAYLCLVKKKTHGICFQSIQNIYFAFFTGFAFIYMEDERDAEYAIRGLDRKEFGRKGRRLRVEWTKVANVGNFYPHFALLLFVRFFFSRVYRF